MTDISHEIDSSKYADQTTQDLVHNLTATVDALHRIGTTNPLLSDEDKLYLQYAHDLMKATRNGIQEELQKTEQQPSKPMIVTARKGDTVRAVTGLRFRDGR